MKSQITIVVTPKGVSVTVKRNTGGGFSTLLSFTDAVTLADKLNLALDDPDEATSKRLLKKGK